jgi:lysophospholipid acyltransferase
MGLLLRMINNVQLKHLFSCIGGIFLLQWIFEVTWIHPLISTLLTYFICRFGPKKYNHIIVFVFLIVYVVACHTYYMYTGYMSNAFQFTGTQMVLTMKLSGFAYNLYDGRNLAKSKAENRPKGKNDDVFSKYAIYENEYPSLLEYLGYALCFTTILAGPSFEYRVSYIML